MEDNLRWKTPSMEDDLQWKMTANGRQPPMEDYLKILNVEYLTRHISDHTQILDLNLNDQTIFYKSLKLRLFLMSDDLRCKYDLKVFRILRLSS